MTNNPAEAILRDVPRYDPDPKDRRDFVATPDGGWLNLDEVLAVLTAAMDPALSERAGEVLPDLQRAADDGDIDCKEAVSLIPALLAQNAALRAERVQILHREEEAWRRANYAEAKVRGWEATIIARDLPLLSVPVSGWGPGEGEQTTIPHITHERLTDILGRLARAEAAEAEVEKLRGLLCLADEALMESHGCFPIDRTNERQIFLNDACTAIRKVTGDDYAKRKERARAALTTEADNDRQA